jgi:lysophospholipid acyltransferase (LPLAT)-like uncharacterized protein
MKSATTYGNFVEGILDCFEKAGLTPDQAHHINHGTTLVINAYIQRRGARAALVTTKGFRDILEIARGNRPDPFDLHYRRDEPLSPRSLRFETTPEDLRAYTKKDVPVAIVLWHNRLFLAAEIVRRYRQGRPAYALVSASKDGAWLTAFFSLAGMRTVRGSSSRLGREAATALVDVLRAGYDVGITPDGPRGPCYEAKPGGIIVARRTQAPLLLIGAEFESAWQLRSWDRFFIPRPFSRVRMRCEVVTSDQLADRDAATAAIQARLRALNPDHPTPDRPPVVR